MENKENVKTVNVRESLHKKIRKRVAETGSTIFLFLDELIDRELKRLKKEN